MVKVVSRNYVPDCLTCEGKGIRELVNSEGPYTDTCVMCMGSGKWCPGSPCPCGCGVLALKLTKRGHVVGCKCRPCLGARNRKKGRTTQRNMHEALGGEGWSPSNEEWAAGYELTIWVQPEAKKGAQIPASLLKGLSSEWFRRALRQAEMATSPGKHPAVYIEPEGTTSAYMIVAVRR